MYKIIGGDGQEYGPVTEADLCKWIAEGRLNGQSLAKGESDAEFRPLSAFPEFSGALGATGPGHASARTSFQVVDWTSRGYELDIGGCISRGWNLIMNNPGILFGSTALCLVLVVIVFGVISVIGGAIANTFPVDTRVSPSFLMIQSCLINTVASLVIGPLSGGLYYVFIQTMRGQPPGVGALFIGFQKAYLRLFAGCVIFFILNAACTLAATSFEMSRLAPVLVISDQARHGAAVTPEQSREMFSTMISAFSSSIPILLICLIPWFYLFANLVFIFPLIIDKEMGCWMAIKTSCRMVHKHLFTVFGLVFLIWLINIVGFGLCCIPGFFTFAFTTAACMFAYETIFGESRSV